MPASKRKPVFRIPKSPQLRKAPVLAPVRKRRHEEEEESLVLREFRKLDYAEQEKWAARFFNVIYGQTFVTTGLPKSSTGLKSGAMWIDANGFLRVVPVLLLLVFSFVCRAQATAQAFVNSIGINTHFSYTDSIYYRQFPLVRQALIDLRVRHIRDGLHSFPPDLYTLMNELGDAGIDCDYVIGESIPGEEIAAAPGVVNNLEALENANEADLHGDTAWVAPLKTSVAALKAYADAMGRPVIGPSLVDFEWWNDSTNSFLLMGDISSEMTRNNLHNYFGVFMPETHGWGGGCIEGGWCYGSIPWSISQANLDAPGVPIWTTETGYTINAQKPSSSVPESVFATYLPRLLFAQWNAGIERTYLYELADDPSTPCCMGLMDGQGNRRKSFHALQNLTRLLSDKGKAFTPRPLDLTIDEPPELQHTLLAKSNGTYWLALWLGVQSYDPYTHELLTVTPETVTVSWRGRTYGSRIYKFDSNGDLSNWGHRDGDAIRLSVDDNVLILKIAMII
jgi:hypothetical protein